jgi:DNA-binding response OmpR family regulator
MTGPASRKRILLVDDEIDVSVIFKSGLERHGFTVEVYNDPREALANFKAGYYDLLLLDVRMPFMSGFELLKEMRKKDWHAKVCFISAYEVQDEDLAKHVPHENSPSIIKKPISIKDLVQRINRV